MFSIKNILICYRIFPYEFIDIEVMKSVSFILILIVFEFQVIIALINISPLYYLQGKNYPLFEKET